MNEGDPFIAGDRKIAVSRLAAIIPALNEAASIEAVVRQVSQRALTIVVDDGSTDGTATLAKAAGAHVVSHRVNKGYDSAIETGLRTAIDLGCVFAVTIDADGQHDPALIDRFHAELDGKADLVVGQRDYTQRWSEAMFSVACNFIWGLRDPLCGMKGYRLAILADVDDFNTYISCGTELALRLIKGGVKVSQPLVQVRPREGASRFGNGLKVNLRISKALWLGLVRAKALRPIPLTSA